jgi:hypothetical protein
LGALALAVVAGIGIFTIQNGVMWTPLQRWYWGQYLNTEVFPTRATSPHGNYRLLAKVDRHGQQRMAVDADVVPMRTVGRQLIPFALSTQARQAGAVELVVDTVRYTSQQMHDRCPGSTETGFRRSVALGNVRRVAREMGTGYLQN